MIDRADDVPPEALEDQMEEDSQAQTVTDEAMGRNSAAQGLSDTEKVKGGVLDEDDVEDIVDHMNQMDTSGNIDMSAYDGEDAMDDLENRYGQRNAADPDFSADDS
ncbi:hypothetical protein [Novosphingobium panipatense]|uniref:Uncharacterized protein n=1 Tax=Novosphingobium panipatense TaxID=428991 RepID=A0ABY1QC53_9SPHN|nr:hypothetical protein [Novosphingobium panipatense]SMP67106.1 hypothetical protein SAMN06296065_104144 [Novosphingobium panipatense]